MPNSAPTQTAWADEATQASWKRTRRIGRVWVAVGILCLAGFFAYVSVTYDHADWLEANGVKTRGVVLADPAQTLRCGRVPVPIRYSVDGVERTHDASVSGCGGGGLHKGDLVTVRYNPANPSDFLINGEPNESPFLRFFAAVALVVGAFFAGFAGARAWRLHQQRRILKDSTWALRSVRLGWYGSPWSRNRVVIELTDQEPPVLLVSQANAFDNPLVAVGSNSELEVAGAGRAAVLRRTGEGHLVYAATPRRRGALRRADRALERVDRGTTRSAG